MIFEKLKSSKRLWLLPWILVSIIVLILCYGLGFYIAQNSAYYRSEREQVLSQQLKDSEARVLLLQRELAQKKVGAQVDRQAVNAVQKDVVKLEQQLADQKEEIAFYREYIDPKQRKRNVLLRSWKLYTNVAENGKAEYDYRLILQSANKKSAQEDVIVQILIEAKDQATQKRTEVLLKDAGFQVQFKYFKALRKRLVLPEGVSPEVVIVRLRSTTGKTIVQRKYAWQPINK